MRIAEVAPLYESVPPRLYGGTERIVHYLTEELVALGHEVTLFASGDSRTSARLIAPCDYALRLDPDGTDPAAAHTRLAELLAQRVERGEFDVLHLHTDHLLWPLARRLKVPFVNTFHGRLDLKGLAPLCDEFREASLVSISDSQREPLPEAAWATTIYHGLPTELYRMGSGKGGYLAFLGRIAPEKRVDLAIQVAEETGMPLRIGAKVDAVDREYFEREIERLLDRPRVEYLGEITDDQKAAFLGDASALIFPIDWPEPFGLVMIEALACSTPVIALRRGSVPEVLRHATTGFIVDDVSSAVEAVRALPSIRREDCRRDFEQRFTARRMAEEYVALFESCVGTAGRPKTRPGAAPTLT